MEIVGRERAAGIVRELGEDFAVIENEPGTWPRIEVVPLAPKQFSMHDGIDAVLVDLDGTLVTTEALVTEALEETMRIITGHDDPTWKCIDHEVDLPHLVGASTKKSFEYLIGKYGVDLHALFARYLQKTPFHFDHSFEYIHYPHVSNYRSGAWLNAMWLEEHAKAYPDDPEENENLASEPDVDDDTLASEMEEVRLPTIERWLKEGRGHEKSGQIEVAEWIYGHFYLDRLFKKTRPDLDEDSREYYPAFTGSEAFPNVRGPDLAIRPMPGVEVFVGLMEGDLLPEIDRHLQFLSEFRKSASCNEEARKLLERLCRHFKDRKPKIRFRIVTSAGKNEVEALFRELDHWIGAVLDTPEGKQQFDELMEELQELRPSELAPSVYHAVNLSMSDPTCASDVPDFRLKPHRDLYSVALQQLGVSPERYHRVIVFEDSLPGIIAARAAGIGMVVALPSELTKGQDFSAASHVCYGGFPEVILDHGVFLEGL